MLAFGLLLMAALNVLAGVGVLLSVGQPSWSFIRVVPKM
jgi:hypothetical protein